MPVHQLQIIFENENFLFINKPAAIHSVQTPRSHNQSIAALLRQKFPFLDKVADKQEDAGLVNRLDFMTSGILIGAKNRPAWQQLKTCLADGGINKEYLTLLEGEFAEQKEIETMIGSPYRRAKKIRIAPLGQTGSKRFLPAKSRFKALRFIGEAEASFVRVCLTTGRRHQIRAHSSFLKHPLVGDFLYGSKRTLFEALAQFSAAAAGSILPDFLLHAWKVAFTCPLSGVKISITAEVPRWLEDLLPSVRVEDSINPEKPVCPC